MTSSAAQWRQGLFECFGDKEVCLCGALLGSRQIKDNATNLGKNGWLYCIASLFVPCIPIYLLRREARARYNIEGSKVEDLVTSHLCGPLVSCQTSVEIKERGDNN